LSKTVSVSDDVYERLLVYTAKLMKERLTKVSLGNAINELLIMVEES